MLDKSEDLNIVFSFFNINLEQKQNIGFHIWTLSGSVFTEAQK